MTPSPELIVYLRRVKLGGLALALVGGLACIYGYANLRDEFYPAYLTAYLYWLGMSLGCLGLAMLHGLTGGAWGTAIRRVIEAGFQTLPLMAVLFVPLWLGVERIYEWADPEVVQRHELLARKAGYLNVAGFHTRAIIYFVVWIAIGWLLILSSPNDETQTDSPRSRRLQRTSALGFIAYGLTITLAAVDWVMSLEPEWYSTMYGVLYMGGQAVSGMSFALVAVLLLGQFEPWSRTITSQRRNDLGNLLLAFVMFWAYVAFMQYLVIWSGNLPEENVWYLRRSQGGWQYLVISLMALHFAVPFSLLLSRSQKRDARGIFRVAILLLVMRYVDLYWLVVPGFQHGQYSDKWLSFHWLDLATMSAIGGGWLALFGWRLLARVQLPIYDPELVEAADERTHRTAVA
ncbi:MAG: hypothetical protein AB7G28_02690 [Pirellulales bacterium]